MTEQGFGPQGKPLGDLTDAELYREVQARRRKRAAQHGEVPLLSPDQAKQYLANLELTASAGLDEVRTAYKRLVEKYTPATEAKDAERRKAGQKLLGSLETAYLSLVDHLS